MYQLATTVYEVHGKYHCRAELSQDEGNGPSSLGTISFAMDAGFPDTGDEHGDILLVMSEVCPRIARKLDVYLF